MNSPTRQEAARTLDHSTFTPILWDFPGDFRDFSNSTVFRDGKGTFSYKNGDVYVGRFNNGEFNGKGKMSFGSLDAYEGDFIDGRLEGHGVMEYKVRNILMASEASV